MMSTYKQTILVK